MASCSLIAQVLECGVVAPGYKKRKVPQLPATNSEPRQSENIE